MLCMLRRLSTSAIDAIAMLSPLPAPWQDACGAPGTPSPRNMNPMRSQSAKKLTKKSQFIGNKSIVVDLRQYTTQHVVILKLEYLSFCNLTRISKNTLLTPVPLCLDFAMCGQGRTDIHLSFASNEIHISTQDQCVVPLPCASVGFPLQRFLHLELAVACCARSKKNFFGHYLTLLGPFQHSPELQL